MIVPQYWAEGRCQQRHGERQVTVRRFGWSDTSQADAQHNADSRAEAAMARIVAGENLARREPKQPYNGAEGVPIREEIVSRHGDTIVTRNGYGALCLNTERVLFADVDFESVLPGRWAAAVNFAGVMTAIMLAVNLQSWGLGIALVFATLLLSFPLATLLYRNWIRLTGGEEQRARARIAGFSAANPAWQLRVYRTPAGFRVLVMHQTFEPLDPEVARCFIALHTDPIYQQMCRNQRCFRARVSPKPWRMGMASHIRPRPGVWPITAERLPERQRWLTDYDARAREFAACRFVEVLGSKQTHPDALAVQHLHDEMCRAGSQLPLA